mmetsp:Transcript_7870/g.10810  ORF Transcript_7870/g.10810 Transcript_7870/m.10810 type:complete len:204 (-) Transcript_7870:478-1089(-)
MTLFLLASMQASYNIVLVAYLIAIGLDDVRDLQQIREVRDSNGKQLGYKPISGALKVISNEVTIATVKRAFPYLAKKQECVPGLKGVVLRRVAQLDFISVSNDAEIVSDCGLRVKLFPVYHGGKYISLGFEFGQRGEFVYISDVSALPKSSMDYLRKIPRIKILVVDCLQIKKHTTHFNYDEAVAFVDEVDCSLVRPTYYGAV